MFSSELCSQPQQTLGAMEKKTPIDPTHPSAYSI